MISSYFIPNFGVHPDLLCYDLDDYPPGHALSLYTSVDEKLQALNRSQAVIQLALNQATEGLGYSTSNSGCQQG